MNLLISRRAAADIEAVTLYVAAESPRAAAALADAIERRLFQLVDYPHSGVPRDDIAPGIRHLVVGRHLAFYRVTAETVDVLRLLHGMRRTGPADFEQP